MLTVSTAAVNIVLGLVYLGIGTIALIDLKRGWKTDGFSHFGAAFIALAYTCGPHHLAHGIHIAFEGRQAGALDLLAVVVGLPAGAIFVALRVESFAGGAGDRWISGSPLWIRALPTLAAVYLTAVTMAIVGAGVARASFNVVLIPNAMLVGIYATIGYFMLRTQLRNHAELGGWSMSGGGLMAVFPTCAVMHAIWVLYGVTGRYEFDVHGFIADVAAVPAGLYFLWVVRELYRGSLRDWNASRAPRDIALAG